MIAPCCPDCLLTAPPVQSCHAQLCSPVFVCLFVSKVGIDIFLVVLKGTPGGTLDFYNHLKNLQAYITSIY